ncbi:MAG TPA: hypothetical protein VGL25_00400 [Casimicrobiaceae bacterium]|jgi:hypothetical protein
MSTSDIAADGVADAMQLAADESRLRTATADQLAAAATFLARALASLPDRTSRNARLFDAISRLETATKAIGAELRRRAFV